jgi:hypothetical protein
VAKVRENWEAAGFIMQEDRGILLGLLTASLPMGFRFSKAIYTLLAREEYVPGDMAAAMLPILPALIGIPLLPGAPQIPTWWPSPSKCIGFEEDTAEPIAYDDYNSAYFGNGIEWIDDTVLDEHTEDVHDAISDTSSGTDSEVFEPPESQVQLELTMDEPEAKTKET